MRLNKLYQGTITVLFALVMAMPALGQAAQAQVDFSKVAQMAIPAVVWVKVEQTLPQQVGPGSQESYSNPWEIIAPELFRRFNQPSQQQPVMAQASGFIVSADGYILTNNHVVERATRITVTLRDGVEYKAKLVGTDASTDVAILKIEATNLPFLKLGDSSKLLIGQWAIAVGNPLGLQASLTVGVISATGRNNFSLVQYEDFIQTDAAVNRGMSGGPLMNTDGEVIGMNTFIVSNTGGYMGMSFAIPSNICSHIMDQIIATGTVSRGFLGVNLQSVDSDLAAAFGLDRPEGALIAEVVPDSPAAKAGLRQGDVILSYNGINVENRVALRNAVAMMNPGTKVKFQVNREGKTIPIQVEVGTHPTNLAQEGQALNQRLGLEVQDLTSEIAQKLGYVQDAGVVVSKVSPNGPAALVGLQPGSLILKINHKPVASSQEFKKALDSATKDAPILMLVKQGNVIRFVSIRVE